MGVSAQARMEFMHVHAVSSGCVLESLTPPFIRPPHPSSMKGKGGQQFSGIGGISSVLYLSHPPHEEPSPMIPHDTLTFHKPEQTVMSHGGGVVGEGGVWRLKIKEIQTGYYGSTYAYWQFTGCYTPSGGWKIAAHLKFCLVIFWGELCAPLFLNSRNTILIHVNFKNCIDLGKKKLTIININFLVISYHSILLYYELALICGITPLLVHWCYSSVFSVTCFPGSCIMSPLRSCGPLSPVPCLFPLLSPPGGGSGPAPPSCHSHPNKQSQIHDVCFN